MDICIRRLENGVVAVGIVDAVDQDECHTPVDPSFSSQDTVMYSEQMVYEESVKQFDPRRRLSLAW